MQRFAFLSAPPPPYATDLKDLDVPPSYDTAAAQAAIDKLTPEEREKFEAGIAAATSAADLQPALKNSAELAAQACQNIESMFVSLTATLTAVDAKYTPPGKQGFAPQLAVIQQNFRKTVWDSQRLALDIGHYGEKFDDLVLPYCTDKSIPFERRLNKIDQFIKEAEGFSQSAGDMQTRFTNLKDDFSKFVGTFGTWAKDKEAQNDERVVKLQNDIIDIQAQLAKLDSALKILLAGLAATLPMTGIIAIFSGPFAPLVMAAGAAIAGVELSSVIGIVIAKTVLQNRIDGMNREIKDLQNETKTLQATRLQLEETGKKDLELFSDNIGALAMVWQAARNDAYQVKKWLEDGEEDIDAPKYMLLSIGKAVGVYRAMAQYLYGYANGVTNSNIPPPASK